MFAGKNGSKKPLLLVVATPFEEGWRDKIHTDAGGYSYGSDFREHLLHNDICR
jgi:hypothetical protein